MSLPIEIIGKGRREVTFVWDEDDSCTFPARDLRLRCRCAHCVDELSGAPLLDPQTIAPDLTAVDMELMGVYGIRITFSDGHGTGIYRFRELHERCHQKPAGV